MSTTLEALRQRRPREPHVNCTYSAESVLARMGSSLAACIFSWNLAIFSFALTVVRAVHLRSILLDAAKPGTRESAICCNSFTGASHLSTAFLMAGSGPSIFWLFWISSSNSVRNLNWSMMNSISLGASAIEPRNLQRHDCQNIRHSASCNRNLQFVDAIAKLNGQRYNWESTRGGREGIHVGLQLGCVTKNQSSLSIARTWKIWLPGGYAHWFV